MLEYLYAGGIVFFIIAQTAIESFTLEFLKKKYTH